MPLRRRVIINIAGRWQKTVVPYLEPTVTIMPFTYPDPAEFSQFFDVLYLTRINTYSQGENSLLFIWWIRSLANSEASAFSFLLYDVFLNVDEEVRV